MIPLMILLDFIRPLNSTKTIPYSKCLDSGIMANSFLINVMKTNKLGNYDGNNDRRIGTVLKITPATVQSIKRPCWLFRKLPIFRNKPINLAHLSPFLAFFRNKLSFASGWQSPATKRNRQPKKAAESFV